MKRALVLVLVAGIAAGAAVSAEPGTTQKLSRAGILHRVAVETVTDERGFSGQALHHIQHFPNGSRTTHLIAGTETTGSEQDPALDIDPVTDLPIVVWSRPAGAGADLWLSVFDGSEWCEPLPVVVGGGGNVEPLIRVTESRIHLLWKRLALDGASYHRLSLDRVGLGPSYGPEPLDTQDAGLVSASGEGPQGGSDDPPRDAVFFAVSIASRQPGDPGRVVVWGVRDEPMPVGYSQGFELPDGLAEADRPEAGWIGDRFALWFRSSGGFLYTLRNASIWSDLHLVETGDHVTWSEAHHLMEEMLLRPDGEVEH